MSEDRQGVVICGLPHSGNRLIERLLKHHGLHHTHIGHFQFGLQQATEKIRSWEDEGVVEVNCLVPVRAEEAQWRSFIAQHRKGSDASRASQGAHHLRHFVPVLRYMAERGIAVLPVVYEDIVARPEDEGRRLMAWLGVYEWKGWPAKVYDANAKWIDPDRSEVAGALRTRLSRSRH